MKLLLYGAAAIAATTLAQPLAAQVDGGSVQDQRLAGALRLAQEGQADSARAVVAGVLAGASSTDPVYPEALFVAGQVAAGAAESQRYYQRVAVEYGWSDWADDALLKLAQYDFANGNAPSAARNVEKLARDYPTSPVLARAAYWGVRAGLALNDDAVACRWVSLGLEHVAPDDVETANQLRYFSGRCTGVVPTPADSSAPVAPQPAAPQRPQPQPAASGPTYFVQVAAVSTRAAADQVMAELEAAGEVASTVSEGGLLKVRVGPLASRDAADAMVRTIRERRGGQPFVVVVP